MEFIRKHKYRIQIFIFGLIILSHAIIPHHHHFDFFETHFGFSEFSNSNTEKHSKNTEKHCHAFNIVVVEKSSQNSAQQALQHSDFFISKIKNDLIIAESEIFIFKNFDFLKIKSIFFSENPLRAPPSIS